ncbi:hypothetical protein ABVK25_001651 [Lepraria finkii]|uniref:Uncharacterized protein n=1 Tax=Lepraria finkii TaxID=1340010 RepID=A0ABR4BJP8_9LECA
MSDGAREKKRVKLTLGMPSKNGTPQGSRSGSPEVPNVNAAKAGGSRAGSPVSSRPADAVPLPTAAEIRAVVPATGITVSQLLAHFKGRNISEDATRKTRFMKLMKENTQFERVRRVLLPL